MPYSLKGNSVVKSDSGEVVKTHPTREKALRHLRALKANVEEGAPAVLGALLEGFDAGKHPRDFHGRWRRGDKVHTMTPQGPSNGVVSKGAETYDAITSKGTRRQTTVEVHWHDGDVSHESPGDLKAGHHPRGGEVAPDTLVRQARMASSSRERALAQREIEARRRVVRPRVRESVPEVLGALLEGR